MLDGLPLLHDPVFYAVAVPAVLLMGLSKSGFAAGLGSLATPLVALTVPAPQAAAIMLPLLLAMDATGLQQLWRERDRRLVRQLVPWGLLGVALGTALFGLWPPATVAGVVGVLTLLFLAHQLWRHRGGTRAGPPARESAAWAAMAATTAGFTSFVAHAGGPPLQAYVLPLRRPPVQASATMAVFFAAINLSKVPPYAALGLWDLTNLATSAVLLPLAPLGVWGGVWLVRRISNRWFYRLAYVGMAMTGLKLLWDGVRGA